MVPCLNLYLYTSMHVCVCVCAHLHVDICNFCCPEGPTDLFACLTFSWPLKENAAEYTSKTAALSALTHWWVYSNIGWLKKEKMWTLKENWIFFVRGRGGRGSKGGRGIRRGSQLATCVYVIWNILLCALNTTEMLLKNYAGEHI